MDLDYNTRLAAIQRNEKLAQIMQQQAFQPIDIQSYQGFQAPISPLAGLAKVLQAYMGAKGTGDEERIKLNQEARAEAQQMLSSLNPQSSPGRAAVMGMPEIQARPATSFTPMGADYEDNPNLQTAPSGNVETPAVAYQPAVAPQAAIAPQPAQQLNNEERTKRLVQIMMAQNPYASPVAKLEYERLGKQESGPLAEYRLAQQQGYTGTMKEYQIEQSLAKRPLPNNTVVNMPSGAPITAMVNGQLRYVQIGKGGEKIVMEGIMPPANDLPITRLMTLRDSLPTDSPDRKVVEQLIEKEATQSFAPNATVKGPTGTSQATPAPLPGQVNVIVDGKPVAMPIAQAEALNASFKGAETSAVEGARSGFEFVTVTDPNNSAQKILVPKSSAAAQAASGTPLVVEADKKVAQGISVIELAEKAKGLLPQASSGALSTLATIATDAAGYATNKSAADASLKVISAGLTSNVPRFEGPQGVLDVQLYKQAAADVGNPLVPYKNRIAALNTVIELNQKYLPAGAALPNSVRRITPRTGQP
jgi:hypothetical protein